MQSNFTRERCASTRRLATFLMVIETYVISIFFLFCFFCLGFVPLQKLWTSMCVLLVNFWRSWRFFYYYYLFSTVAKFLSSFCNEEFQFHQYSKQLVKQVPKAIWLKNFKYRWNYIGNFFQTLFLLLFCFVFYLFLLETCQVFYFVIGLLASSRENE